jgi:hypothetical protein
MAFKILELFKNYFLKKKIFIIKSYKENFDVKFMMCRDLYSQFLFLKFF